MTDVSRLAIWGYKFVNDGPQIHSIYTLTIAAPSNADEDDEEDYSITGPLGGSGLQLSIKESSDNTKVATNRVAVVDRYLYALLGDEIYRLDYRNDTLGCDGQICVPSGEDGWRVVHQFSQQAAGKLGRNTGIYPCLINVSGQYRRYITAAYNAAGITANHWRAVRFNVDTQIADSGATANLGFTVTDTQGSIRAEIFYDNRLFFIGDSTTQIGVYNPTSNKFSTITMSGGQAIADIWGPHDFCPYKGRLWLVNRSRAGVAGATNNLRIWEINGDNARVRLAITGILPSQGAEEFEGRCSLFTDREYLYAIYNTVVSGVGGHYLHRISSDASGQLTYHDSRVLFGGRFNNAQGQTRVFTEQNSYPDNPGNGYGYNHIGASQRITVRFDENGSSNIGTGRTQYKWQGPGSIGLDSPHASLTGTADPFSNLNAHYYAACALSHVKNGGGERIWNVTPSGAFVPGFEGPGPRAEITTLTSGSMTGCVGIHYKIMTNTYVPNGTPLAVQFKHNRYKEMPWERCKLRNPSVGTLADNGTVIRIAAADSGTSYYTDWDFRANGYNAATDRPSLNLFISTTGAV